MKQGKHERAAYLIVAVLSGAITAHASAFASDAEKAMKEITIYHLREAEDQFRSVELEPGEFLKVKVEYTCAAFDLDVKAVKRGEYSATNDSSPSPCVPNHTLTKTITHDANYGGYVVSIARKDGGTGEIPTNISGKTLRPIKVYISVPDDPRNYSFSGGFTVSSLTDPRFEAGARSVNNQPEQFIRRNKTAEDEAALGIAGFVHVFHTDLLALPAYDAQVVATLGIGLDKQSDLSLFVGPSLRLGAAYFTSGVHLGQVKRLKAGLNEGDTITDANQLSELDKRTDYGWFLSFSYSFIDAGQNALTKPFKTDTP